MGYCSPRRPAPWPGCPGPTRTHPPPSEGGRDRDGERPKWRETGRAEDGERKTLRNQGGETGTERDKEMAETWEMERNAPMRKDPQRDRGTGPRRGRARDGEGRRRCGVGASQWPRSLLCLVAGPGRGPGLPDKVRDPERWEETQQWRPSRMEGEWNRGSFLHSLAFGQHASSNLTLLEGTPLPRTPSHTH